MINTTLQLPEWPLEPHVVNHLATYSQQREAERDLCPVPLSMPYHSLSLTCYRGTFYIIGQMEAIKQVIDFTWELRQHG